MSDQDSQMVIREVTKDVVIFSKPFSRFGIFPMGGRSTAIKLQDGGVWVLASTPLTPNTKAKLKEMGPIKYIICADIVHHLHLADFKREYPEAKLIGPEGALARLEDKSLKFDGAWGRDPEGTQYGFETDIQHCYFSGFQNKDVAFYHKASKSLIQADLLLNLPPTEQYSKTSSSGRVPFISNSMNPYSSLHKRFIKAAGSDVAAMRRDAATVASWDFTRIIPCHGDVIEEDGNKAWRSAYEFFLQ